MSYLFSLCHQTEQGIMYQYIGPNWWDGLGSFVSLCIVSVCLFSFGFWLLLQVYKLLYWRFR